MLSDDQRDNIARQINLRPDQILTIDEAAMLLAMQPAGNQLLKSELQYDARLLDVERKAELIAKVIRSKTEIVLNDNAE
jgi:hypothetical protein